MHVPVTYVFLRSATTDFSYPTNLRVHVVLTLLRNSSPTIYTTRRVLLLLESNRTKAHILSNTTNKFSSVPRCLRSSAHTRKPRSAALDEPSEEVPERLMESEVCEILSFGGLTELIMSYAPGYPIVAAPAAAAPAEVGRRG